MVGVRVRVNRMSIWCLLVSYVQFGSSNVQMSFFRVVQFAICVG